MKISLVLKVLCECIIFLSFAVSGVHAKERIYYIAAEKIEWDYAPIPRDLMMGHKLSEEQKIFIEQTNSTIGKKYYKVVYKEYMDSNFNQLKPRSTEELHLGLLGPIIRAEVGDTLKIVFKNKADRPYSIHAHGVFYGKASEGALTADNTSAMDKKDDALQPGDTYTYEWQVTERAGPGPDDPSSIVWLYHSHVSEPRDTNTGLVGVILVTRKGLADENARPKDIDREFVTYFSVIDENESWYIEENIKKFIPDNAVDTDSNEFIESNLMHAINGYVFANLPGLKMKLDERVRWYLVSLGTEVDLHTPHWHGNTGLIRGHRTDVVELLPASMKVLDMQVDNLGIWMFHCHVNDHIKAGMTALYEAKSK